VPASNIHTLPKRIDHWSIDLEQRKRWDHPVHNSSKQTETDNLPCIKQSGKLPNQPRTTTSRSPTGAPTPRYRHNTTKPFGPKPLTADGHNPQRLDIQAPTTTRTTCFNTRPADSIAEIQATIDGMKSRTPATYTSDVSLKQWSADQSTITDHHKVHGPPNFRARYMKQPARTSTRCGTIYPGKPASRNISPVKGSPLHTRFDSNAKPFPNPRSIRI